MHMSSISFDDSYLGARAVAREESPRGLEHDRVAGVAEAGGGRGERVVLAALDDDRAVSEGRRRLC